MLTFCFPSAQLRGPREKTGNTEGCALETTCLCLCAVTGRCHSKAASCSMAQRTFFAVSSNSFCLLLVSFAILFLVLSLSSFKNSLRVNSSNCFLTERESTTRWMLFMFFYRVVIWFPAFQLLEAEETLSQVGLVLSGAVDEACRGHPLRGASAAL